VSVVYRLPRNILDQTFAHFRGCGCGRRECQVLWVSSWAEPQTITQVVHPKHEASLGGFILDNLWLNEFWFTLAQENLGIRIQVHTHPKKAFHSRVDDAFPIIHTAGFLSLVVPNFALGPISFEEAFLTEIQEDGSWREVVIAERLLIA
jgi:hypothetical protein